MQKATIENEHDLRELLILLKNPRLYSEFVFVKGKHYPLYNLPTGNNAIAEELANKFNSLSVKLHLKKTEPIKLIWSWSTDGFLIIGRNGKDMKIISINELVKLMEKIIE